MLYNPRLDVFINVANAGSFTKAAKEEYITPAAVMKQINLLEKELGVQDSAERTHQGLCSRRTPGIRSITTRRR